MATKTSKQPVKSAPETKKKASEKPSEAKPAKAVKAPAAKPIETKAAEAKPKAAKKPVQAESPVDVPKPEKKTVPKASVTATQEASTPPATTGDEKWGEIRNLLLKMKSETLQEISRSIKTGSEANAGEEPTGDIYDQASSERDRELGLILNDREREKVHNIDDALLRMDDGDYGICEECDEDIPLGRLKVLPFTRHCVRCKSDLEKVQAQTKRFEEDRAYREIPIGDEDEG